MGLRPIHLFVKTFLVPEDTDRSRLAIVALMEGLVRANQIWLAHYPNTPRLYDSKVIYRPEVGTEEWQDIPTTIERGWGDCEDLACWLCAERRMYDGLDAKPFITWRKEPSGTIYHVTVMLPDGTIEDPSRSLGMTGYTTRRPVFLGRARENYNVSVAGVGSMSSFQARMKSPTNRRNLGYYTAKPSVEGVGAAGFGSRIKSAVTKATKTVAANRQRANIAKIRANRAKALQAAKKAQEEKMLQEQEQADFENALQEARDEQRDIDAAEMQPQDQGYGDESASDQGYQDWGDSGDDEMLGDVDSEPDWGDTERIEIGWGINFKKLSMKDVYKVAQVVGPAVAVAFPAAGPVIGVGLQLMKAADSGDPVAVAKVAAITSGAASGDPKAMESAAILAAAKAVQNHVAATDAAKK